MRNSQIIAAMLAATLAATAAAQSGVTPTPEFLKANPSSAPTSAVSTPAPSMPTVSAAGPGAPAPIAPPPIRTTSLPEAPPSAADKAFERLAAVRAENVLLKEQLAQADMKNQMLHRQRETERLGGSLEGSNVPRSQPTVTAIQGLGDRLVATLTFPNGVTLGARTGETLPNGMRVQSVSSSRVTLEQGTRRMVLAVALKPSQPFSFGMSAPMLSPTAMRLPPDSTAIVPAAPAGGMIPLPPPPPANPR